MAYIKFCIIAVETSLKDQSIYVTFNKEIDTDTISLQNVILAVNDTIAAPVANFQIIVGDDLKTVKLLLTDTPIVNTPYVLVIRDTVKDLEGNNLDKSLFRNVTFASNVTSDIDVKSPANFEIITEQTFVWEEKGDSLVNSYRLQVSSDTGFHNVQVDTLITDKRSVTLGAMLKAGQYYFRIRAEQDEEFGLWSQTRTFLVQQADEYEEETVSDDQQDEENEETVIEDLVRDIKDDRIIIEEKPANGVTPETSFMFLLSEDINNEGITVSVIRSDF